MDGGTRGALHTGVSFGLTSGVITTLGLMVGLHTGTHSVVAVAGGIVTIAIADALSDALGIHISEESKVGHTTSHIWIATGATFFAKLSIALTFLVPVLYLDLGTAVIVSVIWGLAVLAVLSHVTARRQGGASWKVIAEHLTIALVVVAASYFVGEWVEGHWGGADGWGG